MQRLPRSANFISFSILLMGWITPVHAQDSPPTAVNRTGDRKTLLVATESKSDSVIAVPPVTSVTMNLRGGKKGGRPGRSGFAELA